VKLKVRGEKREVWGNKSTIEKMQGEERDDGVGRKGRGMTRETGGIALICM
jgi:hypothetical protein